MNSLELFSGAGGLAKGLELSGFKHAALVEFNKHAYTSLCENFDAEKVFLSRLRVVIPSRNTFIRQIILGYVRYGRILGA
jgi:site-specific DNA-cytosine methylase